MRGELRKGGYIRIPPTGKAEALKRLGVHMSMTYTSEGAMDRLFRDELSVENLQRQLTAMGIQLVISEDLDAAGNDHAK